MTEHPIRLSCDEGETLKRLSQFVGRHCDYLLDGEPLDRGLIYAADEIEGVVLLLKFKEPVGKFKIFEFDRIAKRPVLDRRLGRVEIRLRDTAPPEARNAYRALRRGDWMHALAIVDAYDKERRDADRTEEEAYYRAQGQKKEVND